jgi:hypothetical protein
MLVFENMKKTVLFMVIGFSAFSVSCNRNKYEVVERSEKEVPNFMTTGTHTEVHYVLLNGGHKFYATCDWENLNHLDPSATCSFRPLRTYECVLNNDPKKEDNGPLSDLKCKDDDGHNVYLYVEKKE